MAKQWIKSATKGAHGQFASKAKAAGKSTAEFAAEKADAPGALGKQARLAKTLMSMHKPRSQSSKRQSRYGS
jgi:hypothetical protein